MCGIAGILNFDRALQVGEEKLLAMREILRHRGPDGEGILIDGEFGMVQRRLAIIDLSENGKQPFFSADGRYSLILNGEIFNYKELRDDLKSRGRKFRSESDTEVLLLSYLEYGVAALDKLNGMFAFVVWDNVERSLFIARDRIGVKPLYYSLYNNHLTFASEPKAIFASGVPLSLNNGSMNELLLFKYVAGESTVFEHVKRLLPGHHMVVNDSRVRITRWWNLPEKIKANRENLPKDPFEWFESTFYSSVNYRTISDVPVGVMLSGGLDSSSVAAGLHYSNHRQMAAFTFTFSDERYDELPLARLVAKKFGLNLHPVSISQSRMMDFLREAAWFHDEPLIHQNDAQMLALAREAKRHVSVLLSGEGGDEFLGGYVRYKPLQHRRLLSAFSWLGSAARHVPSNGIVNRFDKLARYLKDPREASMVLLNASNIYPADLQALGVSIDLDAFEYRRKVLDEARDLYPNEPARQAMYMDLFVHMASVLDRNDRMTMGAGVECRVPFMDYRLMEMVPAFSSDYLLKGKKGKFLLLNSVGRHLPEEIRTFKKLGFSVPWEKYVDDGVFNDSIGRLNEGSLQDIFPQLDVAGIIGNKSRDSFIDAISRQLIMVDIWKENYARRFQKPVFSEQ